MGIRKFIIIAIVGCLGMVLCLVGASTYLNSEDFRVRLLESLNRRINGHIQVGQLSLSLLGGKARMNDLELTAPDGTLLVELPYGELRLYWPALLRGIVRVEACRLERPRLTLLFDDHDRLTLAEIFSSSAQNAPTTPSRLALNFVVGELYILDAALTVVHPSRRIEVRIEPIEIRAAGDLAEQSGHLHLNAGLIRYRVAQEQGTLTQLSAQATYSRKADPQMTFDLHLPDAHLSARGELEWHEGDPLITAVGELDLMLKRIGDLLPAQLALEGRSKARFGLQGRLVDPEAHLNLEVTDGAVLGIRAEKVSVDLLLKERHIAVKAASAQGPWGVLSVAGRVNLQPLFVRDFREMTDTLQSIEHDLTLSAQALQLWHLPMVPLPWLGTWQGKVHLAGSGVPVLSGRGAVEADLQVNGFQLPGGGHPVQGILSITTQWDKGLLTVGRCRAEVDTVGRLEARGIVDLDRFHLDAQGKLDAASLSQMARFVNLPLPDGQASMTLEVKGALDRLMLRAALQADRLRLPDLSLGSLSAEVELKSDTHLRVSRLALTNQTSRLSGEGRLTWEGPGDPTFSLGVNFDQLDPAHFIELPGLSAQLNGRLTADGSLADPGAELILRPGRVAWKGFSSQISGTAGWRQDRLTLTQLILSHGKSALELQGEVDWRNARSGRRGDDPRIKLDVQAEKLHLEEFAPHVQGTVSAKVVLDGPLSQIQGRFEMQGDHLDLSVQKIPSLRCSGRLEERTVYLDQLIMGWSGDQQLVGSGRYHWDRRFALKLSTRALALSHVDLLQRHRNIEGVLDLTIDARGSLDQPEATADLGLRRLRFEGRDLEDMHLRADLKDGELLAQGRLVFPLRAAMTLVEGDFSLEADLTRLDLSPYLELAGLSGWRGGLSGKVAVTGNRRDPAGAQVRVALDEASLSFIKTEVVRMDGLALSLENGAIRLPPTRLRLMQEGHLILSAQGILEKDLSIAADGLIPVAVLEPFAEGLAPLTGNVRLNATAHGPVRQLAWRLDLALERIGLGLPEVAQRIEQLSGRLSLNAGRLDVSAVSARVDEGVVTVEGQIALADMQPHSGALKLALQAVPLEIPNTLDVVVSSELSLSGNDGKALLEGQITLQEGSYYKNVRLDLIAGLSSLTQARRAEPVALSRPLPAWMERIVLNVAVVSRSALVVDNNLARLDIVPDLKISGTAAHPLVHGRADVTEGQVMFRGRTFTINRGVVDFLNPRKIEPSFDIEAEATIREWKVTLALSGTPDQLVVKLSSDPNESESDILSLILLGRTSAEISSGEGGATTQQMLAGLLASAWGEDLKKSAGMDILDVQTGAQSVEDSADRIQVSVGKKVNPRLTLKYEVESNNGEMIQRAVSEYRLLEHLVASGFQDNKGRYGGELLFRLEFR